ncbi:MAG: protease [Candidatus Marinimicrobia bacterium]|nr:protease [Candidatus Neomarinimicrobiota bacterium]OUW50497.1 MAG: hypothetical protein CBD50_01745 [bacterium TMED190]
MKFEVFVNKIILYTFLLFSFLSSQSAKYYSDTFSNVVKKVNAAVVTINSEKIVSNERRNPFEEFFYEDFGYGNPNRERTTKALGSGVIVDAKNGHIITNNHVVEGADQISIVLMDEREFDAEVLATDPKSDLAILKIDAKNLTQVTLGNSDNLDVGEWVLAIGSPFSSSLSHTVTAGIVSAKGRTNVIGGIDYEDFIQTDAAINPGNSGGALVNLDAELIGINTAIATGGYMRSNAGVGFAIPSNLASVIMNDLISEGRVIRSWLGVFIQDVDDGISKNLKLPDRQGALVTDIVDGSPAEKAGFKIKDVIIDFSGNKIKNSSHLKNVVSSTRPKTIPNVKIIRDGKEKFLKVELVELPKEDEIFARNSSSLPSSLGMRVENINQSILNRFGLENIDNGVIVIDILNSSIASKSGITIGDVISRVGDTEINSVSEFRIAINNLKDQESVLFLIKRRGGSIFIPLEMN